MLAADLVDHEAYLFLSLAMSSALFAEAAGAAEITRYLDGAPHGPSDPDDVSQVIRTSLTADPNDVGGFTLRARLGISHSDPRTVSTAVVSGCPSNAASGSLALATTPAHMRESDDMRRRSECCAPLKAAPLTHDNREHADHSHAGSARTSWR